MGLCYTLVMARPKLNIDPEKVRAYAFLGLKGSEIAGIFGCDPDVIRNRFEREFLRGKGERVLALRKAQLDTARGDPANGIPPNATMLIWLGKQELGQTDKIDMNHSGLIEVDHRHEIRAMLTDAATQARASARARTILIPPSEQRQLPSPNGNGYHHDENENPQISGIDPSGN